MSKGLPNDVTTYVEGFHDPEAVKKLTYRRLGNTDIVASHIGIGGCSAGGEYGDIIDKRSIDTIVEAVKSGINYIDTSPAYGCGRSEEVIGKALRQIPRQAYYIATKVGRYGQSWGDMFDFSARRTEDSVNTSLRRLGVDHVDLIQVHDLEFAKDIHVILEETLPTLHRIVKEGKARYIGITGYPLSELKRVLQLSSVPVDVVLSYSRATLLDQQLTSYVPFFQSRGVGIINASLTGMRLLTSRGPPSWHPASEEVKAAAAEAAQLCQSRGVELGHVAVQASVATAGVHVHVLGCDDVDVLRKNIRAATSPQTDEEMKLVEDVRALFSHLSQRHWEGVEIEEMKRVISTSSVSSACRACPATVTTSR